VWGRGGERKALRRCLKLFSSSSAKQKQKQAAAMGTDHMLIAALRKGCQKWNGGPHNGGDLWTADTQIFDNGTRV
jgi:hypothetical protein